jgi:hypothetical protein
MKSEGRRMFDNEISQAILLLKDENLIWSSDFDRIRKPLAGMLERALQVEYHYLEPDIGDLAILLTKEGEKIVRELRTTETKENL